MTEPPEPPSWLEDLRAGTTVRDILAHPFELQRRQWTLLGPIDRLPAPFAGVPFHHRVRFTINDSPVNTIRIDVPVVDGAAGDEQSCTSARADMEVEVRYDIYLGWRFGPLMIRDLIHLGATFDGDLLALSAIEATVGAVDPTDGIGEAIQILTAWSRPAPPIFSV